MTTIAADAVVVGGGPAATAAASWLAASGLEVTLVHTRRDATAVGESLPPAVVADLSVLGIWRDEGHERCGGVRSSWGMGGMLREADFTFNLHGGGWRVDRTAFDRDGLTGCALRGVKVIAVDRGPSVVCRGSEILVSGSTMSGAIDLRASYALDCTGRVSAVARRNGSRRVHADRLVSVITTMRRVAGCEDNDTGLTLESVRDGWWYTCRVPGDRRVLAYFTDRDLVTNDLRDAEAFVRRLADSTHVGAACDPLSWRPTARVTTIRAANSSRLDVETGERWLAAGDAAMAFDPLSSIGILAAVSGGQRAAEALLQTLDGDGGAFDEYRLFNSRIWQRYVEELRVQYGYETRWHAEPFWRRRHR